MKSTASQRSCQPDVDNTRFDHGVSIANTDLQNFTHPRECDHHATADRKAASSQTGPSSPRNKGHFGRDAFTNNTQDLIAALRKDHDIWNRFFDDVSVTFVNQQFIVGAQESFRADNCGQAFQEIRRNNCGR